jgi:hypothetical protein
VNGALFLKLLSINVIFSKDDITFLFSFSFFFFLKKKGKEKVNVKDAFPVFKNLSDYETFLKYLSKCRPLKRRYTHF